MEPFYSDGLRFSCRQCSGCCRGAPGFVYLSRRDLESICTFMKVSPEFFTERYCRWVPNGGVEVLSLIEKSNNDCIFWEAGKGCVIYPARPFQCSSYPFWASVLSIGEKSWQALAEDCPGINCGRLHTREEIESVLEQRKHNPYISRKKGGMN